LVLLTADWQTVHRRRRLQWDPGFYVTEWHRLAEARLEADLVVQTDFLTAREVAHLVVAWWDRRMGLDHLTVDARRLAELRRQAAVGRFMASGALP
jgi:hypothetical protein